MFRNLIYGWLLVSYLCCFTYAHCTTCAENVTYKVCVEDSTYPRYQYYFDSNNCIEEDGEKKCACSERPRTPSTDCYSAHMVVSEQDCKERACGSACTSSNPDSCL